MDYMSPHSFTPVRPGPEPPGDLVLVGEGPLVLKAVLSGKHIIELRAYLNNELRSKGPVERRRLIDEPELVRYKRRPDSASVLVLASQWEEQTPPNPRSCPDARQQAFTGA